MSITFGTIVADFSTSLATKLTAGATSCSIQSATDDDSVALPSGTYSFTIDGDSSQKEHITATLSGTALTAISSITRQGTASSGAARTHRIGAKVVITDYSFLGDAHKALTGSDGLPSLIKYDSELTPTTDYQIVYKKWVEDRNGYWTGAVADSTALPIGAVEGEARVTLDDGKIYVWDIATADSATIASVDTGTDVVTTTGAHGLSTGEYIYLYTDGTLPLGLSTATPYYVYVDSATTFHLSLTKAGATVDITAAVTDTDTLKEASWVLAGAGGGAGTVYVDTFLGTDATDAPTNTTFTLTSGSFTSDVYLQVYVNGVLMENGASEDYTTSGTTIVILNTAVEDTDKVTLLVVSVDLYNPAWGTVTADILPDTHDTHDIGATANRFDNLFLEGNADIDGTLNVEGATTIQGVATIGDASLLATSAAPSTDAMIANKKYVDDSAHWTFISTDAITDTTASGYPSDTSTIPATANFVVCDLIAYSYEGGNYSLQLVGQCTLIVGVIDTAYIWYSATGNSIPPTGTVKVTCAISGSTLTITGHSSAGGGSNTTVSGNVHYYT